MEYKYRDESLLNYIEKLSAKTPCPGGGSASILSLALANALILMVCNFTMESKKVDETARQISNQIIQKAKDIQQHLIAGIEQDSNIYHRIQETAKRAKINPANQKLHYDALQEGIQLHIEMLDYCKIMLEWNSILVEKGNPYLISDVGVSASLILSFIEAAKINIFINLCDVKNKGYVYETIERVEKYSDILLQQSHQTILKVQEKILSNIKKMEEK